MKCICHSVNFTVNTICLLLTRSNIHTKFYFKKFAHVANLHFNMIFYFPVKHTVVEVYFIITLFHSFLGEALHKNASDKNCGNFKNLIRSVLLIILAFSDKLKC